MTEITRERVQELLDRRNWGGFWAGVSMLDRSGLPQDVRDAGTSWDRMVAALTRWRDSLPETPADDTSPEAPPDGGGPEPWLAPIGHLIDAALAASPEVVDVPQQRRARIEQLSAELDALVREEEAQHEALQRTPEQLRAMDATTLREHIADCARTHGQRDTTPAWTAMRWALDALAERDGAVPRCGAMRRPQ